MPSRACRTDQEGVLDEDKDACVLVSPLPKRALRLPVLLGAFTLAQRAPCRRLRTRCTLLRVLLPVGWRRTRRAEMMRGRRDTAGRVVACWRGWIGIAGRRRPTHVRRNEGVRRR